MPTNSLLVQINATVCFVIGWPVNLLLIWLIMYRTNRELRIWSRVLLQSAILDMAVSLFGFLNQLELISLSNGLYMKFNGPFESTNLTQQQIIILFYLFTLLQEFSRHAIAVQFGYRWLVICRDKHISNKFYILMLLIPFTFVLLEIVFLFLDRMQNCHDGCETDKDNIFLASYGTNSMLATCAVYLTVATITTNSIITFSILCWLKTRKGLMQQNEQSRKINRQVSIVLIVQAVYPIGFTMIPVIVVVIFLVIGMPVPTWLSLLVMQVWNTVVYPMIAILVIGHYRRSLAKMLGLKKNSINASSGTQQIIRQANANQIRNGRMT